MKLFFSIFLRQYVAAEIRSTLDELKLKFEKERQAFVEALSKSSKENYMETLEQQTEASFLEFACCDLSDHYIYMVSWNLHVGVGLMLLQQLGGIGPMAYYASNIFEEADLVDDHYYWSLQMECASPASSQDSHSALRNSSI
ncbi:hypothetical protein CRYUN_Cryun21dG0083900 [Craigia yunnanensis]